MHGGKTLNDTLYAEGRRAFEMQPIKRLQYRDVTATDLYVLTKNTKDILRLQVIFFLSGLKGVITEWVKGR